MRIEILLVRPYSFPHVAPFLVFNSLIYHLISVVYYLLLIVVFHIFYVDNISFLWITGPTVLISPFSSTSLLSIQVGSWLSKWPT